MRWRRLLPVVLLLPLAFAIALAARGPATGEPLPRVEHVLVLAAPGLALRELRDSPLSSVVRDSAAGAMSVRAVHTRPDPAEGYIALGSGARTRSVRAVGRGEIVAGRVRAVDALLEANSGRRLGSLPGALGSALAAAGRDVVVAAPVAPGRVAGGPGDAASARGARGEAARRAPAVRGEDTSARGLAAGAVALAAMDRRGAVAVVRGEPLALARRHDVVFAAVPDAVAAARLVGAAPRANTLVLLVSVSPARDGHLTPVLVRGPGVPAGRLVSESTRRDAIVTLSDVAPTILAALGVARPQRMHGRPLRARAGAPHLDRLLDLEARSARQATSYRWAIYLAAAGLLSLAAIARVRRRGPVTTAALAVAALPLATYLIRLLPNASSDVLAVALIALVALAAAAAARLVTRTARGALTVLFVATATVLGLDGATGGWLHTTTMLGYSLPGGGRFYGMPNSTFSLLAAASVLAAGLVVERRGRAALPWVATGFAVVALLNCLPGLGSDVGGLLTLTPVFGITWLGLSGRRIGPRHIAALAVAALALLIALAGVDLMRPDAERTHLGRLAAEILSDGPRGLWDAIVRKESSNFDLLLHSPWSIALIVVLLVPLLLRTRLSPAMSAAVTGTVVLATVGFALNDSGPVVVALALFYVGPLLAIYRTGLTAEGSRPQPRRFARGRRPWDETSCADTAELQRASATC